MSNATAQKILLDSIDTANVAGVMMGLAIGADPNASEKSKGTPLHRAMDVGYGQELHQMVRALIDAGADPFADDPDTQRSVLFKAVRKQDEALVDFFIGLEVPTAKPDLNDITPLMLAAGMGSPKLCEMLINASPRKSSVLEMRDCMGKTALMHGANSPEVALFLISIGADPRCKDGQGKTAIDMASDPAVKGIMRAKSAAMSVEDHQRNQMAAESANELANVMALANRMSSALLGSKPTSEKAKPKLKP